MSDTKALYDVVADALANWGNGEAMDAFEALMGRLRAAESMSECRSGKIGRLEEEVKTQFAMRQNSSEMCKALKAELDAEHARAQRAEADNAALVAMIRTYKHAEACDVVDEWDASDTDGCACVLKLAEGEHPGAALLEEVEGLRKRNAELEAYVGHDSPAEMALSEIAGLMGFVAGKPIVAVDAVVHAVSSQRVVVDALEASVANAHNAALEEAAKRMRELAADASKRKHQHDANGDGAAMDAWFHCQTAYERAQQEISALKKTGQGE